MDEDSPPEFLTTNEVARKFRVSRMTITRWADDGLLPYSQTPSKRRRFRAEIVERYLAERVNESGAA